MAGESDKCKWPVICGVRGDGGIIGSARFGLWRVVGLEGLVIGLGFRILPLLGGLLGGGWIGTRDKGSGGTCGKGRPGGRTRFENEGGCRDGMGGDLVGY